MPSHFTNNKIQMPCDGLQDPEGSGLWYLSTSSVTLFCDHRDFTVGPPQGFMTCCSLWLECASCRLAYIQVLPPSCYLGFSSDIFLIVVYLFLAVLGLRCFSLVVVSGAALWLWCMVFSLWWLLLLWNMGSRVQGLSSRGSRALEHRLNSCGAQT